MGTAPRKSQQILGMTMGILATSATRVLRKVGGIIWEGCRTPTLKIFSRTNLRNPGSRLTMNSTQILRKTETAYRCTQKSNKSPNWNPKVPESQHQNRHFRSCTRSRLLRGCSLGKTPRKVWQWKPTLNFAQKISPRVSPCWKLIPNRLHRPPPSRQAKIQSYQNSLGKISSGIYS